MNPVRSMACGHPKSAHMTVIICTLLSFTLESKLVAHEGEHAHDRLRHWEKASADPDRIFLTFNGDPTTRRAVTWRTDDSVDKAFAEIAVATDSGSFAQFAKRLDAQTDALDLGLWPGNSQRAAVNYHTVVFHDLTPDTLYAYRVGNGKQHWSEWIQFKTASIAPQPFEFTYFGDAQNDNLSYWSRTIRMAYKTAPDARFAIHAGDLINRAHSDTEWAEWFKAGGFIHAQWTGVPVTGNHEYNNLPSLGEGKSIAMQWRPQFNLPVVNELSEELHETVYSFDHQGVRVIVMNSNGNIESQTPFLEKELGRPGCRWTVVTYHHSIFSPIGRTSAANKLMLNQWVPLFEKHAVDLVLQGHDHAYVRSQMPARRGGERIDGSVGTIYVTSVSGPKSYEIKRDQLASLEEKYGVTSPRTAEHTQFFHVIGVDGDKLTYRAFSAAGRLYDEVIVTKDFESGRKSLKENIPVGQERTFQNTEPYTYPAERKALQQSKLESIRTDGRPESTLTAIRSPASKAILIAAHRGGYETDKRDLAPENSVANIRNCQHRGYDVFETDIRRSRDGHFVILHDPTLDRETDGKGHPEEQTLAELKSLRKRFRDGSISDVPVATLAEMLKEGDGQTIFKADLKPGVCEHFDELIRVVKESGRLEQIVFRVGFHDLPALLRHRETGTSWPKNQVMFRVKSRQQLDRVSELFQPGLIHIDVARDDPTHADTIELIKHACDLKMHVQVHAEGGPSEWRELYNAGARMFHTSNPARFAQFRDSLSHEQSP
ncbi:MAG: glycerophosphodiester phosphodiesterase family protein [Planctomycetota bacterium]